MVLLLPAAAETKTVVVAMRFFVSYLKCLRFFLYLQIEHQGCIMHANEWPKSRIEQISSEVVTTP